MFQVNRSENRLNKLVEKRFSDLNLREREHLQEWVAKESIQGWLNFVS
jgi:hypothetical protein